MGNWQDESMEVAIEGLRVDDEHAVRIAALRYFDPAGDFAAAVREAIGAPLPEPSGATLAAQFILAWRSPTETLLVCSDTADFAALERRLARAVDGCMVELSSAMWMFRVQGARAGDLLLRLGAATALPGLGEALTGRLAELKVLTICIQAGEFLLLVDRVYAAHLREWIAVTASDF
jgi:sarcosine oxidase gamma subunit